MGLGITAQGVWVHKADSYGTFIHLPHAYQARLSGRQFGRVEAYMNGTLRHIKGPTRSRTVNVTARFVKRRHAERLDGWAGEFLVYRDAQGRALWGTYLRFDLIEEIRYADPEKVARVQFTFLGTSRTASELSRFKELYPDVVYPRTVIRGLQGQELEPRDDGR